MRHSGSRFLSKLQTSLAYQPWSHETRRPDWQSSRKATGHLRDGLSQRSHGPWIFTRSPIRLRGEGVERSLRFPERYRDRSLAVHRYCLEIISSTGEPFWTV